MLFIIIYGIIIIEKRKGNFKMRRQDLKRRKAIGYKIKIWFLTITFREIINFIKMVFCELIEFVMMGLALILILFIIPHFFH